MSAAQPSPTSTSKRQIVSLCVPVIRSVLRIELPSTKQLMIWPGGRAERGSWGFPFMSVCSMIDSGLVVNRTAYMNFREATESLCPGLSHEELAKALGVSVATVRQARLKPEARAHRSPPEDWKSAVIRLAETRLSKYRDLIEKLKEGDRDISAKRVSRQRRHTISSMSRGGRHAA